MYGIIDTNRAKSDPYKPRTVANNGTDMISEVN